LVDICSKGAGRSGPGSCARTLSTMIAHGAAAAVDAWTVFVLTVLVAVTAA
jgi:hypothetical protein